MLKVCIAIEKFDPHVGGAERYCWDLAHFLSQKSHDVAVICMKSAIPDTQTIDIFFVKPFKFPQFLRHLGYSLLHFFKARKMSDYIHFCVGNTFYMDIYQPHGGLHRAWFLRETLRHPVKIRGVCRTIKYINPKDIVQRLLEWWTFQMTKPEVIAISNMVAKDIRSWFGYPRSKVHLLPNGIDVKKFTPDNIRHRDEIRSRYSISRSDFVFLFMANNLALKGIDVLIRATRSLNDLPVKVLVIGPYNRKTKRKVKDLSNVIIFGGRANDPEFIYTACDCLVHPSFYDACSLVVLEALASGIPVITTKANGASMYITKKNGCVVPPGDHHALGAAMREVFSGKAGKTDSSSFKDQETVFTDIEKIIEDYRSEQGKPKKLNASFNN